jgi:AcrR family transcriptional regulator
MPYARFERLPVEKRTKLLESAAQEFAKCGFEDASVNRILEQAQMSKGAVYYYFEDKVDLFCTVVQYAIAQLHLIDTQVDMSQLTVKTFWPTFAELHRLPLLRSFEQPWLFGAVQAAGHLSSAALQEEPLASIARQISAYAMAFVTRGQELGLIRHDLAVELLFDWIAALDHASDVWLLGRWEQLDRERIAEISDQTVDAMRHVLVPLTGESRDLSKKADSL